MAIVHNDLIGSRKAALDTPALMVDLDVMEANIAEIARVCRENGVAWRPHIKGQKTPEIVAKELAAGAIGVTCAKLGEAEVMASAGIRDILIANQIVGPVKMTRLRALLGRADPIVAVDSEAHIAALAQAMAGVPRPLRVVIEVNIGMNRAGVEPGAAVVSLASAIARHEALRFSGVMGWEGQTVSVADQTEKQNAVARAVGQLTSSAQACRDAGLSVDIVSCGGTGTFPFCARQPGVTEVQIGGGIFSDEHYRTHFHVDFPCALTLLATVTSRPTSQRIVLDAGKKSMSGDVALPRPLNLDGVRSLSLSAEHSTIELDASSPFPAIGDQVELLVGYSDTTVHLHDRIVGIRGGRIEAVWEIAARGKSQ